jgi:hypothetical protein
MLRATAIVRLLMILACVLPFPSARQVVTACAPGVPLAPVSEREAPGGEDDERSTSDDEERLSTQHSVRRHARHQVGCLPPAHVSHPSHRIPSWLSPPAPLDPFCNGLGTPYRC